MRPRAFRRRLIVAFLLMAAGCASPGQPPSPPHPSTAHAARSHASSYPAPVGGHFRDAAFAPELVVIPGGSFLMGASDEEAAREGRRPETAAWEHPQRHLTIATPWAVGRYLVTRREYTAFIEATHRPSDGCMVLDGGKWLKEPQRSFADPAFPQTDRDPAVCVNTADAEAYVRWLNETTGHHYRLLREDEWEYAARAGTTTSRWWGDERNSLCAHANGADQSYHAAYPDDPHANTACNDGYVHTNPVDAFPPNPFGLYDMIGNVWEWSGECFVASYPNAVSETPPLDGQGTAQDCSRRSIRGGSWHNSPDSLRSAARFWLPADMRSSSLGFRVARQPDDSRP